MIKEQVTELSFIEYKNLFYKFCLELLVCHNG
jgi:hypothetical protein